MQQVMLQFKKCGLETLVGYRWLLFWSILKVVLVRKWRREGGSDGKSR
ncbi:unnamed protein product [Brugia timori]|uniref:Uncharacterized protein n=1 Tax=Brugia timori TaxID=42155 RepID=A0A3P7VQ85_9BILA|nr:unnamed protein product [Brugia timori]